MKQTSIIAIIGALLVLGWITFAQSTNRDSVQIVEYASVRFMEERTSIIWPDGTVQNVLELAGNRKFAGTSEKYPKGADYRMYWITTAMNLMGQRGFEFVHMHEHDLIMRRVLAR